MIRHVIWDWNGTLLDDVAHAIAAINTLLDARELPRVDNHGYRASFGFPVRDFYVGLGFDFEREAFEPVSESFIARYKHEVRTADTHDEVLPTVHALQALGVAQSVLSAMEHEMLTAMLAEYGLTPFMTHIRGLDHLHATSKVALGVALMQTLRDQTGIRPEETLLIGDTIHDHETAEAMGCGCLLVSHGHQHEERLVATGATVIASLREVLDYVRDRRA